MTSPARFLFALLAIVALGASQILGLLRGYACACSGEAVMVDTPVCESETCHPELDHDGGLQHHHDHGEETPEEPHQHQKVTESLQGAVFNPLAVEAPVLVEYYCIPMVESALNQAAREPDHYQEKARPPDDTGGIPPAAMIVAGTVVMLV